MSRTQRFFYRLGHVIGAVIIILVSIMVLAFGVLVAIKIEEWLA